VAPPVFKTELRGVTLRGWFDSIPSPPVKFSFLLFPLTLSLSHKGRGNLRRACRLLLLFLWFLD